MSFCCLLGGFVFYYKFGTIYYCLVFVLCLKNESTFFLIMDKMLRWLEVISIWLSEIFIVPFILCTRFLASFFPLLSQCWVQHVSTISFVRSFKTTFVPVSSYKNKLDIWLDLQILSFLFFWNEWVGRGRKKGVRSWSFSTDHRACAVFSVSSCGSQSRENVCLRRTHEHLHDAKQMLKSCLHSLYVKYFLSWGLQTKW